MSVLNGNKLVPNGGKAAKLDMPCKYVAVKQQCGGYFVKVTPGSIYVAPRFFTSTVWVEVRDAQGNSWEGRTATKIAAKYINDAGTARKAFVKVKGNLATDSVLTFSKTDNDITATATDGSFSVTFGPYDPTGSRHRNVDFTFTCNADDTPPAFPEQICGGEYQRYICHFYLYNFLNRGQEDVQYMAEELGFKPGQKFKPHMRDQTYYYAIFTDVETDQTPYVLGSEQSSELYYYYYYYYYYYCYYCCCCCCCCC
nr:hypothetical protein BaRGS_020554 [Batillaria attramentaria]